ncbi:peptidase domain-containing ABC transporter [Flavobacterium sp. KACC 22761]|uniref:peptidase domain-containing ABC transporter n=1 Tax=Flavobacterium sp. KACC 22761 TaxID=3092665 RepID=UPI002A75E2E8|nr:peptidase domain-containing ABC transporter [Flavobacterium sp. KACC 22761]WPO77296.1 peptidase domain-containing ABC transporter [Flavobacterium sp. KACC 22761]
MFNFPHEHQLDAKDCGPTCIKIIAKYYGRFYSLPFLRDLCGITREGVSFLDLSDACEKISLRTKSIKIDFDTLKVIPLPCIVHWQDNHFIVVYKINHKQVFVSDPAKGLLKYSFEDFQKGWLKESKTGAVLAIEPMADFKQRSINDKIERRKTLENFLGYFTPYKKSFINLFVVMLIVTVLQAFLPFISKSVIDVGIQTNDLDFIDLVLIANITIIVSILLSNMIRDWILLHLTSRINISLISDYLIKLMRLPITFFENKLIGDILQRAQDHERIRDFIMNNSLNFVFSILTFFIFGIILCIYSPILCLIYVVGSVLFMGWVLFFLRFRKKLDWEYFDVHTKNQSYWVETIGSIQDIKINNYEKQKRWKWEALQVQLFKIDQKILRITNAQNLGAQFINQLTNLVITFYCAKAVIKGDITFGVMISTQFIIGMLNGPIMQFISFIQSAQYAKISFLRLNEIHELENEEENDINNNIKLPEDKSLFLRNVSFQYSRNGDYILSNISVMIPEGKVTAIVGDSGSGKTTLLKLILRLYNPTHGELSMGNLNIKNINLKQWRESCGAVMQDGKIFSDTIQNNIVLDDENIDFERLKKAVTAANIASEIESMPKGYQTMMGESGRGLSGGQKQRVLIARALYKDPDYLFFDEATNSLDVINEQKIVMALEEIFKNKTVIVVAHRLSTIRKADQIIVLKNGYITEIGNHDMLMSRESGHYYQLVKTQIGDTING